MLILNSLKKCKKYIFMKINENEDFLSLLLFIKSFG
jgi:hypothetical protein